jgi:hypothetical protein
MKKIAIIALVLFAFACKPKPLKLNTYKLKIYRTEYSTYSSPYEDVKIDTIKAINDTLAYQKGLRTYFANRMTDAKLGKASMYKTKKFVVQDSSGNDISIGLPIDSIKQTYYKLHPEFKNY